MLAHFTHGCSIFWHHLPLILRFVTIYNIAFLGPLVVSIALSNTGCEKDERHTPNASESTGVIEDEAQPEIVQMGANEVE